MLRLISLHVCETWPTTKTNKQSLARFERKITNIYDRNFGPKRNLNTVDYGRRTNEEVIHMIHVPDIVATMKSEMISWAEHIW